ncbi:type II toxin-antitoxin system HicB family antitoxin [Rhodopseudomonas palustris]|uniref:HicB family protein n=1 Tax=Rhodopseudomonas palustris TaxID=1076 RepID=A0A418UX20_RHOPL|nr:type II toxin-antitoxin system HicB family antitoxin [Rhodopseudomonas palustris]RJF63545.1 HicB family protein [Rhodopseudomonas palustris]
MVQYVALIHKDADGSYGVSFPDIRGVITAGDTIEEAMEEAAEVLLFAAEDWTNPDGSTVFNPPRTIDDLRKDPAFVESSKDAIVALIEYPAQAHAAE